MSPSPFRSRRVVPVLALFAALPACARYRPAPLDAPAVAAGLAPAPAGSLAYEDAVRHAVAHNPSLAALRARAAAVNVDPSPEPIGLEGGVDMDERGELVLSLDVLSLLGVGPRDAERAMARARRSEAWLEHHAQARAVAASLAEAYAVERALRAAPEPDAPPDPSAFVAAGVEVAAAGRLAESVAADRVAVLASRDAERAANEAMLRRLLGAAPGAPVSMVLPAAAWPPVPETPAPAALVLARDDLQRRLAAYEVADAELRRAVAGQAPGIEVMPGLALDPSAAFGGARLRLPVNADREVVAAEAAREAARLEAVAALAEATEEAAAARAMLAAATAKIDAATRRHVAGVDLLRTARARLDAGEGSALELVMAARDAVMAAGDVREASVEAAKARVRAARAAGWPSAEAVR
ncbi:MAG: hypothetical protein IT460_17200 [Planctomycetes bacterium]|nr:hypothetical protein [Planctomycetota bacterium]